MAFQGVTNNSQNCVDEPIEQVSTFKYLGLIVNILMILIWKYVIFKYMSSTIKKP
jgi:hypothetical protein